MNEKNRSNNYLEEEKPLDLQDIVNKFIRRRNLFFYIAVPIFLGIILAQFLKSYSPIYRATFDIGVTKERPVEGFFSTYQETPTLQIGTVTQRVISNLLSVNLAEKVVDTLSLYVHIKNGSSDITIEAKIRQDFKKPIGPLKLQITGGTFKIFKNGAKLHEGRLNEFIELGDVAIRITPLTRIPDGKTYTLTIYPRNRMALALRNSLTIKVLEADKIEQEMGSGVPFSGEEVSKKLVSAKTIFPGINLIGILRISVHWGNPGDALRIAEVLSEQIITEDITEKSLQFIQSKTFIDSQLTLYQEQLNQLEEKIKQFKEGKKIADLRASTQALINQISGLESTRNQLQIEQKILSDLNRYLSSSSPTDTTPTFASTMFSDAVLQNFYSQLLQTEAELRGLLKEYSSSHPKVLEIRAKFDGLKEQVKEEVNKRTSSIKTEIAGVQSQINMLQGRLENVPEDEILLARLERDKETAEKLYTFFAEKLEETRVQEAGVTSDLRIINPPLVSSGPVNARRPFFTIFLALVIGVLAGGFAVFIAEYVDNTIKDPEMVKARINLPIFASIPVIENAEVKEEGKKANLLERIGIFSEFLKKEEVAGLRILSDDVSAPEFESFRKLSINLEFAHPEKTYRVIYVTSPGPEEGKTFIALNLGFVLGAMGKKAIVIDTDFRKKRGHLTDVTKLEKEVGLFDVLKGDVTLQNVIIKLKNENTQDALRPTPDAPHVSVDLLSVGRIPPNPFVFLESQKMRNLLGELKISYDYVIIDGVPILLFADATYLAKFTDGILLTARYGRTGFKELENACDILTTAQSNIIGLVINGVPITRGSYYYRYYHKYYTKYYKKE